MNYANMTTENLETLKSSIEEKLDGYIGMSFPSPRSEYVTYEIDSIDSDEILITANHDLKGLIRDYTVTIEDGVQDDVDYNLYNTDEEIVDGGYISFDRLSKEIRNVIIEIYELYRELETIDNILDSRAEEETEESEEEEEVKESEEMLLTVKRVIPQLYEVSYKGQHITDLIKTDYNDWRFVGFFAKDHNKTIYLLLAIVFNMRFKTKKQATLELEEIFARFEVAKNELGN